jgi:hypothetical protein
MNQLQKKHVRVTIQGWEAKGRMIHEFEAVGETAAVAVKIERYLRTIETGGQCVHGDIVIHPHSTCEHD